MKSSARPKAIERSARLGACALVGLASLLGCKLTPQDQNASSAVAPPSAHAPRTFLVPGHSGLGASRFDTMTPPGPAEPTEDLVLQWTKPNAWDDVPSTSSMRLATYRVHLDAKHPKDDAEDGEMTVTQVGGGVEANIARWVDQFEEKPAPARKEFQFEQLKATVVKLSGTYTAGGMQGASPQPKPNTTLLAIIVEAGGEPPYFFKLTGPTATVSAASEDFSSLVKSLRLAPREPAAPHAPAP